MYNENMKKIVNFLFELCGSKSLPRTGWHRMGIKNPESMADHSALSGQIAYIIALMEGADANRACTLALFKDTGKIRSSDQNWISRLYSSKEDAEEKAFNEQIENLQIKDNFKKIFEETKEENTKESIIARDADYLDLAIQAKYYASNGNKSALLYLESVKDVFKTESAKQIFSMIKDTKIEDWWMELEQIKEKFKG